MGEISAALSNVLNNENGHVVGGPRKSCWYEEEIDNDLRWCFALNSILHTGATQYQDIQLLDTKPFGKALVIDGKLQSAEIDEFIYHECLVHPPLLYHSNPRNIFIMGGGEGSTARELLRHKTVDKVVMCDIDEEVVEFCKSYLEAWNSVISGYSLRGDSKSCIQLLQRMNKENMKPSSVTLSSLLMACSKSAQLQHGKFFHAYIIRNNILSDDFLNASLVDLYFKCGRVETAQNIFSKMAKNNVEAWNVMISGHVSAGYYLEALAIYNDMKLAGIKPDAITLTSALVSCSQLAALDHGKEIHKCIIDNKLESNEIVMGSLLDMYAKCGAVSEAFKVFDELPERDLVSRTTMIAAYGSHGQAFEALKLFNEMLHSNVKPDRIAFLAVISACAHAGLVDEGYQYFNLMVSGDGIQPSAEEYSCLIDLLGRAGRLREAYAILQSNPDTREGVELLSALVSACHLHGELEIGEEIAKMLTQKDEDDPSTYVILAKIYASQNKWNEVRKLRLKMKELGLRKKPGCSWIEVDKRIQTFLADDKSFLLVDDVYQCLSLINSDMETYECLSIDSKRDGYYSKPTT